MNASRNSLVYFAVFFLSFLGVHAFLLSGTARPDKSTSSFWRDIEIKDVKNKDRFYARPGNYHVAESALAFFSSIVDVDSTPTACDYPIYFDGEFFANSQDMSKSW